MFTPLLLILALAVTSCPAFTLLKCCPDGEALAKGKCTKNPTLTQGLQWFPFSALYNKTTNQAMTPDEQDEVKKWLSEPDAYAPSDYPSFDSPRTLLFNKEKDNRTLSFRILVESKQDFSILINVHRDHNFTHNPDDSASVLKMSEVCIDRLSKSGNFVAVFLPSKVFIQKCCPHQHVPFNGSCVPSAAKDPHRSWRPRGPGGEFHNVLVRPKMRPSPWLAAHGARYIVQDYDSYECRGVLADPHFFKNGSVKVNNEIHHEYCVDVTRDNNGRHALYNVVLFIKEENKAAVVHAPNKLKTAYGYLFIIGGVFLFVTVVISLSLPRLRYQLHNKIAITHNAILMVVHFAWGSRLLLDDDDKDSRGCTFKVLVIQYTFLASLFWLNVFCLDVSSTFRTTRARSRSAKSENRRYLVYSLYAWGIPALITILTIAMEHAENPFISRPGLTCLCKFSPNTMAELIYLYGPMAILLSVNLTLYIFTTWKIINVQRQTALMLQRKDSTSTGGFSSQSDKEKLVVYTKLFFVMGITWAFYIINWILGIGDSNFSEVTNVINILRPIFIFMIFICKKWVLVALRAKLLAATAGVASNRSTATEAISLGDWRTPSRKTSRQNSMVPMVAHNGAERKRSHGDASRKNSMISMAGHSDSERKRSRDDSSRKSSVVSTASQIEWEGKKTRDDATKSLIPIIQEETSKGNLSEDDSTVVSYD